MRFTTKAEPDAVHHQCARTLAGKADLALTLEPSSATALRAQADAAACRQRFALSARALALRPSGAAASVFTQLSAARSLALGARWLPGIAHNFALAPLSARLTPQSLASWAYAAFLGQARADCPAALWHALSDLGRHLQDELAFAQAARQFSVDWYTALAQDNAQAPATTSPPCTSSPDNETRAENPLNNDSEEAEASPTADTPQDQDGPGVTPPPLPAALSQNYQAYSNRYDRVVHPQQLASSVELEQLKGQLDAQLAPHRHLVARLAHRLQRLLLARQRRHWHKDLTEGWLDATRLPRLITDPNQHALFQIEEDSPFKQTAVTLLLDNSGSMRGQSIAMTALCTDILTHSLERCGIKVEVLGFTTAAWQDNPVARDWQQAGSPAHPGRLNALRHIIYKDMDTPWRRARRGLGVLLKEDLLKENIDGEALWWASSRLLTRPEPRRVLIVISDGAPMDKSTLLANQKNYLEQHLHQVIQWIQKNSRIELYGFGIGFSHPIARYYANSVTINNIDHLADRLTQKLGHWLTSQPLSSR